jgi:putative hemolysin
VTIKDLVSELVGELQDEFDPGTPTVVSLGPGVWVADGRLDIDDLEEAVDYNLTDGPFSTVGGYIMALCGKVPDEGDQVVEEGFRFTVLEMDRQRVDRVRVERLP